MRVLLVDDDELVRAVLVEILGDAGFQVMDAASPQVALGLPDAIGPPGVVITDINLGTALDGFDVAAAAHRLWPKVRVLLISGRPVDHAGQALDPRDRYLQKPFSKAGFLGAIDALVKERGVRTKVAA